MKSFSSVLSILLLVPFLTASASQQSPLKAGLNTLADRFRFLVALEPTPKGAPRYVYADAAQHLHVFSLQEGKVKSEWESVCLGSPVVSLFVADINNDQSQEIIVSTQAGRILAFDTSNYRLQFENLQKAYFETISCMTYANLDGDAQQEVLILADDRLMAFDGTTRLLEWEIRDAPTATMILVANVDDDAQPEIILNSGAVFDSRLATLEYVANTKNGFGERITLLDISDDGIPEVIGEARGYPLKLYDLQARREIW